ncbi:hypothetical protein SKAU_G00272910 [Synaphobranchus kaupii]|uniref:Uncharacterized protein n=1 Tax=Synaphobranchus kaupii TaxID=118154 RepID=A0A9Q1F0M5_SYNKA|nr:hypothetical protein SKAU_G00272910 [Synaphobranchus kaupii]
MSLCADLGEETSSDHEALNKAAEPEHGLHAPPLTQTCASVHNAPWDWSSRRLFRCYPASRFFELFPDCTFTGARSRLPS